VKQETNGMWIEVGDALVREKVSHLFCNAFSHQYKSSTTSKRKRRCSDWSKFQQAMHKIMLSNQHVRTTVLMANISSHPHITGEEVFAQFCSRNRFLLEGVIKIDKSLLHEFPKKFLASMSSGSSSSEGDICEEDETSSSSDTDERDSVFSS
jgi:hypothetical protein